ncbi:hypothetical protein [Neobacillus sp. LXY-4]|uniref:hypothetical protein n=1 Tax=Neobacillus sp. LXY-4 TaxID=3379826 RepID=UPI003EDF2922
MLYKELKNIYKEKRFLDFEFPFEEFYPQLKQFLISEVREGAIYLNPYRFSLAFGYNLPAILRFFLALSDRNGILNQLYKVECTNCGKLYILEWEELRNFICYAGCEEIDDLSNINYMDDIKLIFEINETLLEDVKDHLKEPASSRPMKKIDKSLEEDYTIQEYMNINQIGETSNFYFAEKLNQLTNSMRSRLK